MSFLQNIFGGAANNAQVQSPAATQQATPGNMPMQQSPMQAPNNGVTPANVDMGAKVEEPKSPMADFADLWKNDPNAATKTQEPLFNIDPAALAAATKKMDFSKAISPELLTRINAGGEDAQRAMLEAMNTMQQAAMQNSTTFTTKLIEQALEKQQNQFMDKLPEIIKNQSTFDSLRNTNPILQNSATAPIMEAVLARVQAKHPTSSSEEQRKMAEQYVLGFAELAKSPEQQKQQEKEKAGQEDWSSFLQDPTQ